MSVCVNLNQDSFVIRSAGFVNVDAGVRRLKLKNRYLFLGIIIPKGSFTEGMIYAKVCVLE